MTSQDMTALQAERSELLRLIALTPSRKVMDVGMLRTRLEIVEEKIAQLPSQRSPARVKLTFSGRPVVRSHGIMADFGMSAVNSFSDAVTAVAASLTAPLRSMGPIPNKFQNQLLITNTARGSFGFELEEMLPRQLPLDEPTIVEQALEKTQELLLATIQPDDEDLADAASELDQRALDKVRSFVSTLAEGEAICSLVFKGKDFRFSNLAQVTRSLERMSEGNLHEKKVALHGHFEGVLPNKRRSFEFRDHQTGEVIAGKIGPGVTHPEEINGHLHQSCTISVMLTRVGQGRPRYLLLAPPEWPPHREVLEVPAD